MHDVGFDTGPVAPVSLKANPRSSAKLGAKLRDVREALAAGEVEELGNGRLLAAGITLEPDDVLRGERIALPGWTMQEEDAVSVALNTDLDAELELEGARST